MERMGRLDKKGIGKDIENDSIGRWNIGKVNDEEKNEKDSDKALLKNEGKVWGW